MKKKVLSVISFVLVFVLLFAGMRQIFNFKYLDGNFKMQEFYKQPEKSVDILVLGSSHCYRGINTAVLYREFGYTAYDLCASAQPIWNSYFYLEEALKTQTPGLIILDTYGINFSSEYRETSYAIKTVYGMKFSETKLNAILESFDRSVYGNQFLFDILQYHTRYTDLNDGDFLPYYGNKGMYGNNKGFFANMETKPQEKKDYSSLSGYNLPIEKNEKYFNKILELAKSNDIPIIITAVPFIADNANYVNNAAVEYMIDSSVPFLNFLSDEYLDKLNLDYGKDFSDPQHLNYSGSMKFTRYLGEYIKKNYELPDRRNDVSCDSWAEDAKVFYGQLENLDVKNTEKFSDLGSVFKNDRYTVIMTKNVKDTFDSTFFSITGLMEFYRDGGLEPQEFADGGIWIFEGGEKKFYSANEAVGYTKYYSFNRFDDAKIEARMGKEYKIYDISVNKKKVSAVDSGINVYIYDNLLQTSVDAVGFDYDSRKTVRPK